MQALMGFDKFKTKDPHPCLDIRLLLYKQWKMRRYIQRVMVNTVFMVNVEVSRAHY